MRNILCSILLSVPVLMLLVAQEGKNEVVKTSDLRMTQIAGYELFQRKNCNECHTLGSKQEGERTPIAEKRSDAWFQEHVDAETELVLDEAASRRKKRRILKNEIDALDDFLFGSKPAEKQRVLGLPENIRVGAYLGYQNNCTGCHTIAGQGKEIAPDLSTIADKKSDREWHIKNLNDPQEFAPESTMPAFGEKLPAEEISKIVDYIMTLRK